MNDTGAEEGMALAEVTGPAWLKPSSRLTISNDGTGDGDLIES